MKIECCTACNFGGHKCQDSIVTRCYDNDSKGLFVVCDGMGGLRMGAEASKTVVDVFAKIWDDGHAHENVSDLLAKAVSKAKVEIDKLTKSDSGTTMVMAAIEGDVVTIAHLGDSRAYYFSRVEGLIYQTEDHITIGQEGWPYVSKGFFNFRDVEQPTIKRINIKDGDRLLLCTDGLYGCYKGNALQELFAQDMSIDTMMSNIIGYCDEHSTDDTSGILIEFRL